jgi:lipoprotein-anchoring transpeptidase ErfK/SrfK
VSLRRNSLLLAAVLAGLCTAGPLPGGVRGTHRRRPRPTARFEPAAANDVAFRRALERGASGPDVLRVQVLLDRAHFSVGEIDSVLGTNSVNAVAAFNASRNLPGGGTVDEASWALLNRDAGPAIVSYTIAAADVAGPFVRIPEDTMVKAELPALGFQSPEEALAEKFHASPALLRRLNPGRNLGQAGEEILVPQVARSPLEGRAALVVVSGSDRSVSAFDVRGRVLTRYPASVGSEHDPLPAGDWKILGVARSPKFHYNPDLFWDADAADSKATLAPGPNNPVGVVWVELSKPHYGIHGAAEPSEVGKTQSHGCIRLTNWDAEELASLVAPGTPARLRP